MTANRKSRRAAAAEQPEEKTPRAVLRLVYYWEDAEANWGFDQIVISDLFQITTVDQLNNAVSIVMQKNPTYTKVIIMPGSNALIG